MPTKARRGRPHGSNSNKLVKSWLPIYDQMVIMFVSGATYQQISDELDYSTTRIGAVLKSELGQARIKEVADNINERVMAGIGGKFTHMAQRAVQNLEETINADIPIQALKAKKHQDFVSIKVLEMAGFGKGGDKTPANTQPLLSKEGEKRLVKAIEMADRAKIEAEDEVIEGEYYDVEEEDSDDR